MEFKTILQPVSSEIVEKKSKFIANIFPIESIEEAEEKILEVKKKHYDAKHNCIAYRIIQQENNVIERFSDDGEPSGTAGSPMLEILRKQELGNILAVVTRYFGGILLGTGGLVRAYSGSLIKAIEETQITSKILGVEMQICIEYSDWESFKYYCRKHDISIINEKYLEFIICNIELDIGKKDKLERDFATKNIILKDLKEINKKFIVKCI